MEQPSAADPKQPLSHEKARFKRRDARTHNGLPATYTEYVHRLSYFIVDEICEQAQLQPGDRVLDVGSGTGMASTAAAEMVGPTGHVLGIDHSPGLVELARTSSPRGIPIESLPLEYRVLDAERLDLMNSSFTVIISFSSVMHFPNPEQAISEMFRVLKEGGRIVLTYTAVRPEAVRARVRHGLAGLSRRLLALLHPQLYAPQSLTTLADTLLPQLTQPAEPGWFEHGGGRRIVSAMTDAGFVNLHKIWVGRNIVFNSPEEFFEAQLMINSDLRTRVSLASDDQKEQLHRQFVAEAKRVLTAGGTLVYPFGAVVIRAERPSGIVETE